MEKREAIVNAVAHKTSSIFATRASALVTGASGFA
jgi:hypothetical protein